MRFLPLVLTFFTLARVNAQEVRFFDISAAGITIGEMTVSREVRDSLTYYNMKSDVSFWFFTHVKLSYQVNSVFHKDHLVSSQVTTHSSKGNFKSTVQWDTDHYIVNAAAYNYTNTESIKGSIQTNSARMIFEEPVGKTRALADSYGVLAPLEYANNVYALNVMGKINRYHFSDGAFKRAVVYHSIKNFEITPREN